MSKRITETEWTCDTCSKIERAPGEERPDGWTSGRFDECADCTERRAQARKNRYTMR